MNYSASNCNIAKAESNENRSNKKIFDRKLNFKP